MKELFKQNSKDLFVGSMIIAVVAVLWIVGASLEGELLFGIALYSAATLKLLLPLLGIFSLGKLVRFGLNKLLGKKDELNKE